MKDKSVVRFITYSDGRMASYRYRTTIPACGLERLGHDVKLGKVDDAAMPGVYIFSKHFNPGEEYPFAQKLKDPKFLAANITSIVPEEHTAGNAIIFDICDNHFDSPSIGDYYRNMVELADYVVAATPRMAEVIKDKCPGTDVTVIPDAYEFPERQPRFNWDQKEITNLMWFGHPTNIKHLQRVWNELAGFNIMIITENGVTLDVDGEVFPIQPWSIDTMLWGFAQSHIVIIPNEGKKSCKGANRIIESIRQGVFVIAEPCPAYEEFKEWMYIGDIKEGLEWCKQHKEELQDRVQKAQAYIREKYAPMKIVGQWHELILKASKGRSIPKAQSPKEIEKLSGEEAQKTVSSPG
jgi:hypothetical protein